MARSNYTRQFGTHDFSRDIAGLILKRIGGVVPKSDDGFLDIPVDFSAGVEEFRRQYLGSALMSKYPELNLGIDTAAVAYEKFRFAEQTCEATNVRLQRCASAMDVEAVMVTAQRKIARLLGAFRWSHAEPFCGFSEGASTRLKRRDAAAPLKFSSAKKLHVTPGALPLILAYARLSDVWSELLVHQNGSIEDSFEIVEGNSVTTVPKNAKTDRVIAKEPDCNMFLQRGIGGLIRQRLKRVGVDLDTQVKNQQLALIGSKTNRLATVDLSAASDTIALELVRLLLPDDWFCAISCTRSPVGFLPDGSKLLYQKVSSMGNGFTFELESLIFWALTASTLDVLEGRGYSLDTRLAIYGDDIIVDSQAIQLLTAVFDHAGFSFNSEKSFWDGPFRESCGKHYYLGCDVTPFYIRKPIDNVHRLFWVINQWRRWALRLGFAYVDDHSLWQELITFLPKRFRSLSVPDQWGDNGVLRSFSEARPRFQRSIFRQKVLEPAFSERSISDRLAYTHALHAFRHRTKVVNTGVDPYKRKELVPDFARVISARIAVWEDPFPWVFAD